MEKDPLLSIKHWTPPSVPRLLTVRDRLQERDNVTAASLTARARQSLLMQLGSSRHVEECTFSHGALGIAVDHTVFFDGFALLVPVRDGIAVAIRRNDDDVSHLVFEGEEYCWSFDAVDDSLPLPDAPWWARAVMLVVRDVAREHGQVDVSVVSTIVPSCEESYGAALCMASLHTLQALFSVVVEEHDLYATATRAIVESTDRPCSVAYAIASDAGQPGSFVLVDAGSLRYMDFPVSFQAAAGLALVETGSSVRSVDEIIERRRKDVLDITERLRSKPFPELGSLRDLEHKDLELAEKSLPRSHRPVIRHLVRENQRVHRLVVAARNGDWQFFGALMLMSHSSLSRDFGLTVAETDAVVELAEDHSADGIHGAKALGTAGAVVVIGQPFVVPQFVDRVRASLEERFSISANTVLL